MEMPELILLPDLTGSIFYLPPRQTKKLLYQKDLKRSRKKIFYFINSSFVYVTCGNFKSLLTGHTKFHVQLTFYFFVHIFRGSHNCLITPEAGVLVTENNSRIEQAFPSAGATFP